MRLLLATFIMLSALLTASVQTAAQELSFKEHEALAERFAAAGEWQKAAEQNAAAYELKTKKEHLAHRAAEQFYLVKDYARAAEMYQVVVRNWREYPLAGLRYARSLKQDGKFSEATTAYLEYLSYYKGDDLEVIKGIVELEVKGTEMARQSLRDFNPNVVIEPFNSAINSPRNELAPMPLAPGALYFLSDRQGSMRMYRSFESGGSWVDAEPAGQFPIVPGKHIGPGSLSPLADRFYFSLCDTREVMLQATAKCEVYVILRRDTLWTVPQPLPSYINTPGNSTSHPYVYREGNNEVMIFASDRLDGFGGMDLYRSERYLNSDATDFSFPQNLGPVINGVGDEVSPFYDPDTQTLYFSSNGYINMGGYDVFKTLGGKTGWNTPVNMGAPINSPADDYYYRQIPGTQLAVMASNRAIQDAKSRTNNEDIYLIKPGTPTIPVTVQVVDSITQFSLSDVVIAAYIYDQQGVRRLLNTMRSEDGFFSLELPIGGEIDLDLQKLDYHKLVQHVSVPSGKREGFQLPRLRMSPITLSLSDVQQIEANRTEAPVAKIPTRPAGTANNPSTQVPPSKENASSYQATSTSPLPKGSVTMNSPRMSPSPSPTSESRSEPLIVSPETIAVLPSMPEPVAEPQPKPINQANVPATTPTKIIAGPREYRVQIEARREYEPANARYQKLGQVGALSSNYVDGKNLYRILVGHFSSLAEAQAALQSVRALGWRDAFVAAFDYGSYKGMARD